MAGGITITQDVINGGGVITLLAGNIAQRPAPGINGRYYFSIDENIIYQDTGTAWVSFITSGAAAGVSKLTGTVNQISVTPVGGTGNVTINLPQDIATGSKPTFAGIILTALSTIQGMNFGLGAGNVATNAVLGLLAMIANTTGANNVAIGSNALNANTTGFQNVAVGCNALRTETAAGNNVAVGYGALEFLSGIISSNNVALGNGAGAGSPSFSTTSDSVFLGYGARQLANNIIRSMALGSGATVNASNQFVYGDVNVVEHIFSSGVLRNPGIPIYAAGANNQVTYNTANNQFERLSFPQLIVDAEDLGLTGQATIINFVTPAATAYYTYQAYIDVISVAAGVSVGISYSCFDPHGVGKSYDIAPLGKATGSITAVGLSNYAAGGIIKCQAGTNLIFSTVIVPPGGVISYDVGVIVTRIK